ncbi:unnamed protein product [Fusarium graminearum]|nr:unnamed protein product [Fusarium graminearum]
MSLYGATCCMPSNAQLSVAASTCKSSRARKGRHSPCCACSATSVFTGLRLVDSRKRANRAPHPVGEILLAGLCAYLHLAHTILGSQHLQCSILAISLGLNPCVHDRSPDNL